MGIREFLSFLHHGPRQTHATWKATAYIYIEDDGISKADWDWLKYNMAKETRAEDTEPWNKTYYEVITLEHEGVKTSLFSPHWNNPHYNPYARPQKKCGSCGQIIFGYPEDSK